MDYTFEITASFKSVDTENQELIVLDSPLLTFDCNLLKVAWKLLDSHLEKTTQNQYGKMRKDFFIREIKIKDIKSPDSTACIGCLTYQPNQEAHSCLET